MIYSKTEQGQTAFQNRSLGLLPRQRSAFILFDGKRSDQEVLKATAGLGFTLEDLAHLLALGLLAPASVAPVPKPAAVQSLAAAAFDAAAIKSGRPTLSAQEHYSKAYPVATRLTAELGLRGFRLNLAVEAAGSLEKLKELAPKIRDAVGEAKYRELDDALYR